MKLIDEKSNESWFKMPHALVDHAYPLLTGDAVKTHIVVTRWTHGLKNQRKITSMTLGQIAEKCGFKSGTRDNRKSTSELKQLESNGLIKIHRETGKTNRIEILRPEYKTLEKRVKRLLEDAKVHTVNVGGQHNEVHTVNGGTPHTVNGGALDESTHSKLYPSIDIDIIDTGDAENDAKKERDTERTVRMENTEIIMEVFESHMVHANKYQRLKSGRKRSADIRVFYDMLTIDRIEFNDIMEAIKYVYEGQGGWWSSKIINAAAFKKNFATIYGQVQQNNQQTQSIVGLA